MSNLTARHAQRTLVVSMAAAGALLLAACSSSSSGGGNSSPAASSSTGSTGSSGSAVAAKVAQLEKAGTSYPIPTGLISNVSAVKGKTVYYIPLTQQAPQFAVTQAALKQAFGKVGVSLQVCNGNATPTAIAACLSQATKAKAGAIITDAIPNLLAANAFAAAEKAGIPVLNTDGIPDSANPAAKKLGYIYAPASKQQVAVADWVIDDSKGNANVVINESTDGPAPVAYVKAGQAEYTKECPKCTVTINHVSSANFGLIAPSTSSALLKTPNVGYVVSEFDQYLQPTLGGVQQSGKAASIKGVSGAAQLSGLQMLAHHNFLYADVGQASAYQGWADADAVLRMMTGTSGASLPTYTIPIRLFTRDNIGDITLTAAAQASGEWFGPTNYTQSFLKLWK
jgi:ribose transport system substrate-binding protein